MIAIVVGTSENGVIGHLNKIPWYLPRDLKHFKEVTLGHTVVMGRKTYESIIARIGTPLPDRKNIIITRQTDFKAPDCTVAHTWEEAVEAAQGEDIYVSGGSEIYNMALPHTDRLYLTKIHTHSDGDVYFKYNKDEWREVSKEFHPKDEKNPFDCTFYVYERV